MLKRRLLLFLLPGLVIGGVALWAYPLRLGVHPLPIYYPKDGASADLPADIGLMWETETMDWVADPARRANKASTDRAIHAASRVFNTVELNGKTREEVVALLGDPKTASDTIYKFPFWPAPRGALVYRFDTGAYGWQFNVVFGIRGKVTEVERLWIH